jgi:hypothetical protein
VLRTTCASQIFSASVRGALLMRSPLTLRWDGAAGWTAPLTLTRLPCLDLHLTI